MYHLILLAFLFNLSVAHDTVALKFGNDLESYILINPDMTPVEEAISICSWVNKLQSGNGPTWIRYNSPSADHDFVMSDSLVEAYMLRKSIRHNVRVTMNEWHHVCLTWAYSTKTTVLFFDGNKVATDTTPSDKKLSTGGAISIGQSLRATTGTLEASFYETVSFGGELLKLNIFTRQLEENEVSEMYNSGMCSDFEESLAEDTFLSWDTLVNETPKHGDIVKVDITCPSHSHEDSTEPSTECKKSCSNTWEILFLSEYHDKTVTSDLLEDLMSRFEVLAEFIGHKIDDNLIKHLIKHH